MIIIRLIMRMITILALLQVQAMPMIPDSAKATRRQTATISRL